MTYCVGLRMKRGLVFMSDTRTNSGVDNISTFRKMHSFEKPGERYITIMTAGNLATTQSVISMLAERTKAPEERNPSILAAASMFQVAQIIGDLLRETIRTREQTGLNAETTFNATLIVGGQIKGMEPRLFMVYPEGNFIEASHDTPFFQIGETKYGKPIIDRVITASTSMDDAIKCVLVSFDSTMRSNLSVGMPIDLACYSRESLQLGNMHRYDEHDAYMMRLRQSWGEGVRRAFAQLPNPEW